MTSGLDAAVAQLDDVMGGARRDLEALVRIPSIGIDPAHAHDVEVSADATADLLSRNGFENVRLASTNESAPYVTGEWLHAGDAPTVLLYAHHDVQPPGVEARWSSPPFEPVERNGRL